MDNAEKKWEEWDLHTLFIQYSKGTYPAFAYFKKSREAYKQSLRELIEKEKAKQDEIALMATEGSMAMVAACIQSKNCEWFLTLIDKVEPKTTKP